MRRHLGAACARGTWDTACAVTKLRRVATFAGAIAVLWLAALLVADAALEGRTRRRTAERIAESLQADATIDRGDLALVRGGIDLDDLTVRRDDLIATSRSPSPASTARSRRSASPSSTAAAPRERRRHRASLPSSCGAWAEWWTIAYRSGSSDTGTLSANVSRQAPSRFANTSTNAPRSSSTLPSMRTRASWIPSTIPVSPAS